MRIKQVFLFILISIVIILSILFILITIYDKAYKDEVSIRRAVDSKERRYLLIQLYTLIINAAEISNTKPFLIYGTLLGQKRNNDLICYDFDLDFGISNDEYYNFKDALFRLCKGNPNYTINDRDILGYQEIKLVHTKSMISADISSFLINDTTVYRNVPKFYTKYYLKECKANYPIDWIYPLRLITFLNRKTWIPNNPSAILECYYGKSYMIPDHSCDIDCNVCKKIS